MKLKSSHHNLQVEHSCVLRHNHLICHNFIDLLRRVLHVNKRGLFPRHLSRVPSTRSIRLILLIRAIERDVPADRIGSDRASETVIQIDPISILQKLTSLIRFADIPDLVQSTCVLYISLQKQIF